MKITEPGCLLDGSYRNMDEMDRAVVELAQTYGATVDDLRWEGDKEETLDLLVEAYIAEDAGEDLAYRAIDWLNENAVNAGLWVEFDGGDLVCFEEEDEDEDEEEDEDEDEDEDEEDEDEEEG